MIILGIETSCDETGAAVLQQKNGHIQILSNVVASSASIQAKYGGIIPEQAASEQIKSIIPVIEESLRQAQCTSKDVDAIAVTYGPGLIGSLLVGVETAKTLALIYNKPLIPVNHLIGHFYANWIGDNTPKFPCIGLLVSGGHTDLVLFSNHGKYQYLGGTRDDAAGECFDKCARLLGYPYPGGPKISKLAQNGNSARFDLPRPLIDSGNFDFSFSGLKTAFARLLQQNFKLERRLNTDLGSSWPELSLDNVSSQDLADLCASIEQAIVETLTEKTVRVIQKYNVGQLIVAGGVAANQKLVDLLVAKLQSIAEKKSRVLTFIPPPILCTDNAAMIASAAFFQHPIKNPLKLRADPNLSLK